MLRQSLQWKSGRSHMFIIALSLVLAHIMLKHGTISFVFIVTRVNLFLIIILLDSSHYSVLEELSGT